VLAKSAIEHYKLAVQIVYDQSEFKMGEVYKAMFGMTKNSFKTYVYRGLGEILQFEAHFQVEYVEKYEISFLEPFIMYDIDKNFVIYRLSLNSCFH
jgi:hypothetical protein